MWFNKILTKLFRVDLDEESDGPAAEFATETYSGEHIDNWKQIFAEVYGVEPTEEQVAERLMMIKYSFDIISEYDEALIFIVDQVYPFDDISPEVYKIAPVVLAEYISGNLQLIKKVLDDSDEK